MGIYRKVYQPFGGTYFEEMAAQAAAAQAAAAQTVAQPWFEKGPSTSSIGPASRAPRRDSASRRIRSRPEPSRWIQAQASSLRVRLPKPLRPLSRLLRRGRQVSLPPRHHPGFSSEGPPSSTSSS